MSRFVLLIIIAVSMWSCSSREDLDTQPSSDCPSIKLSDTFSNLTFPDVQILSASADEKNIILKIGVSGCDINRPFTLCVSKAVMKSLPPQRAAGLVFPEQLCDAYFTTELCYDRTQIKEETVLNLNSGSRVVKVRLPAIQ
ncbi:MAG: hypothetical protein H6608_02625 [Flavobacteriales bacterium]|nr:hypothetical protein [Bacteroidota bacterium]MCB9240002.1 hypothetical protein [Flavobacteriales bacterium]